MKLDRFAMSYPHFLFALINPLLFAFSIAKSANFKNTLSIAGGYFLYANPVPFHRHQLKFASNASQEVANEEGCIFACTNTSTCQSVNFKIAAKANGKFLCYLLDTDKFQHPQLFNVSKDFHHYSFTVRL